MIIDVKSLLRSSLPTGPTGPTGATGATGVTGATGPSGQNGVLGFNQAYTNAVGYAVTNSLAAAFTAPATADRRYIVYSIQVANIDANYADHTVDAEIVFSGGATVSLGYTIPVPAVAAIELLRTPKVMNPSDVLRLKGDANSILEASITYATVIDTTYFGTGVDLTSTSVTDVHTATANSVVESILVANDDGNYASQISIQWTDGSNTRQGWLAYLLFIPPQSTVEILEVSKYLPSGYKIRATASDANRLEIMVCGKTL